MLIEWLYELKDSIDKHGIRLGVFLTIYAIYRKERRNHRLDKRDEVHNSSFLAILENQRLIMDKLGVQPCADISELTKQLSVNLAEDGYTFSWLGKLPARSVKKSTVCNMRRSKRMIQALTSSFSKKLIAVIIAAAVTALNNKFGLELNADTIYGLYGVTIAYIIGQSHVDAKKAVSRAVNAVATSVIEAAATTDGSSIESITKPPMSYEEVKPILIDISKELQAVYDQLKSGKFTDESRRAQNIALTIHEYLKQNKGA